MALAVNNRQAQRKPRSRSPLTTVPAGEPLTDAEISLVEAHRADWEFAAYDILGWSPAYAKQVDVLHSAQVNYETYAQAANGVGKTDIAAIVPLLHTVLYQGIVITTATTWNQVRTVLWERMRKITSSAPEPLPLRFSNTELKIDDGWFMLGLSTRDESRFAGYHEPRQMVVVEEATGISEQIWSAIDGVLAGQHDKLFCVYNPLFRECPLYPRVQEALKEKKRGGPVGVIEISAFDTPNVITGRDVVPGMVSRRAVERRLRKWGEDDPRTAARIHGQWPAGGTAGLYPLAWLERAYRYDERVVTGEVRPLDYPGSPVRLGQDIARYGSDASVQALMHGGKLLNLFEWRGAPTTLTAERVVRAMDGLHPDEAEGPFPEFPVPDVVRMDADGLGSGPFDVVCEKQLSTDERQKISLEEWHAGARTTDPKQFSMFKDEAYWNLRLLLERDMLDLSVLDEEQRDDLTSQALAVGYKLNRKGQKVVADKDEIRKKIGRSPDTLEALIIAAYDGTVFEHEEEDALSGEELLSGSNGSNISNGSNQTPALTRGRASEVGTLGYGDGYGYDEDDYFDASEDLY